MKRIFAILTWGLLAGVQGCDSATEPPPGLEWSIDITPSPAVIDEPVQFSITLRNGGDRQVSFTGTHIEIRRLEDAAVIFRTGTSGGAVPIPPGTEFGPDRVTLPFRAPGTYEFSKAYIGLDLTARDTVEVRAAN